MKEGGGGVSCNYRRGIVVIREGVSIRDKRVVIGVIIREYAELVIRI